MPGIVAIAGRSSKYYVSSDSTAPTLSSPTGTKTGSSAASLGVTTNEGNGTLRAVITTSATQPSTVQIKAGQTHTGATAPYAGSQSISSGGAKTFNATGLAESTTYYAHFLHTDEALNDSNRVTSASFTTDPSGGGGAGVFFQPNLDSFTTPQQVFTQDVNSYDGGSAAIVTNIVRPGKSKSMRLRYTGNEAGVELKTVSFPNTTSLFIRHYVQFAPSDGSTRAGWATNWPVGCKTSRIFSRADFSTGPGDPNDFAYISEKLIWQTYGGNPDDLYGRGYNNAVYDLDLEGVYSAGMLFGNGQPYIREGVWYCWERWYVINSGADVADGIMQVWIDGTNVCNRTNVAYRSAVRGCPNGTGWQSMWFGGNYSGATFGFPAGGVYLDRYEDDYYLSTTQDRL